MVPFDRVLIVGVGLIGGSWALALRRAGFAGPVLGFDEPSAEGAVRALCAVDDFAGRPPVAADAHDGDLVLVAAPVGAIVRLIGDLLPLLPEGVVVSDTGSTKRAICAAAATAGGAPFVGGHPMAGSERSGPGAARADLFDGAAYFLVGPPGEPRDRVAETARALGARPVVTDAAAHDRLVARASHLPQLVSTALAASLDGAGELPPRTPGLASMTRLAASPWAVWADILTTNRDEISAPLDRMLEALAELREALAAGDDEALRAVFERAGRFAGRGEDAGPR
jgi:prephenate dehydrogenase